MLLNPHFKITVDNDGEKNNLRIEADRTQNYLELATALKIAEKTLKESLINYFEKNGKITEKEFDKKMKELTLEDIYNVDKDS